MGRWLDDTIDATQPAAPPAQRPQPAPAARPPASGWVEGPDRAKEPPRAVVVKAERIAVCSAKGGSGKTLIAVSLAALLARAMRGLKAALVDADLAYGQLSGVLGFAPRFTWADALNLDLERVSGSELMGKLPQHPAGFWLLASPGGSTATDATYDACAGVVNLLAGDADTLIFDCSDRLEDPATRVALRGASKVLVVTPPDPPAVEATTRFLQLLRDRGLFEPGASRFAAVLNQAGRWHNVGLVREAVERRGDSLWEGWGIPVLAVVPDDPAARETRARQEILPLARPRSDAARAIQDLAGKLVPALAGGARGALGGGGLLPFRFR